MSKVKMMSPKDKKKGALVPRLRFPEFRDEWYSQALGAIASIIKEKAGNKKCTLMSIMTGVGLISQIDKFGKEIAGDQYKNYIILHNNDFAYNKSATKDYPQGFIALYTGSEIAAVPNSIFTCFKVQPESIVPAYLNYLFLGNFHGKWLQRYITVGARAHGSLSIDDDDLLSLPIPYPKGVSSLGEQQRIADCLSSLDERITAETSKLDTLKDHKKGLLKQLFPAEGETLPQLRFPEFRDAGEWNEENLVDLVHFYDGFAFKSTEFVKSKQDATQVVRIADINNKNSNTDKTYIPNDSLKHGNFDKYRVNNGDLLLSLTGAAGFNFFFWDGGDAVLNQRTMKIAPKNESLNALVRLIEPLVHKKINARGDGQNNNLSKEFLNCITLILPESEEQQRIADCLSSLDELISAQTQKIDLLKTHKKGLMQQLFPALDEAKA